MPNPRALLLLSLSLLLGCLACGEAGPPRYTLQQVMYELDHAQKQALAAAQSGDSATVLTQARRIETWMANPAWPGYPGARKFVGDPAEYRRFSEEFRGMLHGLIQAAERNDPQLLTTFLQMRMSCEQCHAVFRPLIPSSMPKLGGSGG